MVSLLGGAWLIAGLAVTIMPAQAARAERTAEKPELQKVTALAAKDPETTSSISMDADDGLLCNKSRKRLFVEGEGWIVRRVTTCY